MLTAFTGTGSVIIVDQEFYEKSAGTISPLLLSMYTDSRFTSTPTATSFAIPNHDLGHEITLSSHGPCHGAPRHARSHILQFWAVDASSCSARRSGVQSVSLSDSDKDNPGEDFYSRT